MNHIVFDLGGVVLEWSPYTLLKNYFSNSIDQELVIQKIINHPDWIQFDCDTMGSKEVAERGAKRTGLPLQKLEAFLEDVPASLQPKPESVDIIKELHKAGIPLYVLSNMSRPSWDYISRTYGFWELFSGKVVSCLAGKAKPDPSIFTYLLGKFQLNPRETLFIDDTSVNITAARQTGMQALQFSSPDQCRKDLREFGIL
ncbi:MAG: HAD family phosphatase [Spirochaetales bacterium]|nr:HAD family phosphatase [Spirochaetales bacterium]